MKAIVLESPGDPTALKLKQMTKPSPQPGWVLIKVKAFGLNRSEMFTRQGYSQGVQLPRVLGIECVGVVEAAPETAFEPGQKVAAIMGGMGRAFDGSYAEYTCVPQTCVFPINSNLDWSVLGAIPEMFQTAYGSLVSGLNVQAGQTLLVRGGSSSVGMAATHLAKQMGLTVVATTRNSSKIKALQANGADHVVIDTGEIVTSIRQSYSKGFDCVLELVGTSTLMDSLQCVVPGGIVCMSGILGNAWTLSNFAPMDDIPHTVKLTVYSGGCEDLSGEYLQRFIDGVEAGQNRVNIDRVFKFDEIVQAHQYMESNQATGKLVVLVDEQDNSNKSSNI
ncbi:zinc-binding alcohol dehydrogenase family protein [Nostoc sp. MS1]|uniref:zinc-binding alcohol dehydrogenase family protein n=1 Tax=Nostoc sp. MS1 TaxID=2764711 RepID=UPI001CC7C4BE|nr:zinc-binding alcohol dehydrogenase family protein [Nostoc sp. MS1]BCL39962.1 NADPH:quinone reductase [Nostoc sp. MS1]